MATRETLGDLAVVVSDLLGRDNLVSRAEEWLNLALSEIYTQSSGAMTRRTVSFKLDAGDVKYEVNYGIPGNFVSLSGLTLVRKDGTVLTSFSPRYLSPQTFFRVVGWKHSSPTLTYPEFYTVETTGVVTDISSTDHREGRNVTFYFDPGLQTVVTWQAYLSYIAVPVWTEASIEKMECTPHWEWVLVWKAAAIGASAIHHPAVDIFEARAKEAILALYEVENQKLDAVPHLRGEAADPTQMRRFRPQVPESIPQTPVGP